MKKDILYTLLGTVIMFVFVVVMFGMFNQTQEIKLIEKQIQTDSTLIHRQKLLEISDSLQNQNNKEIRRILNRQDGSIEKIKRKLEEIDEKLDQ
jgi:uncharacterized membrane protein YgaE (UPF0421/DUF939 family)